MVPREAVRARKSAKGSSKGPLTTRLDTQRHRPVQTRSQRRMAIWNPSPSIQAELAPVPLGAPVASQENRRVAARSSPQPDGAGGETLAPWFASLGWCGPAAPPLRGAFKRGYSKGPPRRGWARELKSLGHGLPVTWGRRPKWAWGRLAVSWVWHLGALRVGGGQVQTVSAAAALLTRGPTHVNSCGYCRHLPLGVVDAPSGASTDAVLSAGHTSLKRVGTLLWIIYVQ